jgi:transcriptional regulator with XRE-family HTH domain
VFIVSFYEKFYKLCRENGTRPSPVCTAIGISKSGATRWKAGATPDGATILKICQYFDVPVSYFYEDEPPQEPEKEEAASPAPVEADRDGDGYGDVVDLLTEMRERGTVVFVLTEGNHGLQLVEFGGESGGIRLKRQIQQVLTAQTGVEPHIFIYVSQRRLLFKSVLK